MKGAIFYASKYGSTAQYAQWISEATGLDAFPTDAAGIDPSDFDFLILGSPIYYYKLMFQKWLLSNLHSILARPTILFTVSGAGPGPKLDAWLNKSLPADLMAHVTHVALCGRQTPKKLSRFDRVMLIIGGLFNRDRKAGKEEMQGFDHMDKSSIQPIIDQVKRYRDAHAAE